MVASTAFADFIRSSGPVKEAAMLAVLAAASARQQALIAARPAGCSR